MRADELAGLRDSPTWFPLEVLEREAVRMVRLDEAAYRAASFLDQRLLQGSHERISVERAMLSAVAAQIAPAAHYLFHTGHVGSTLLSRLIGAHEAFFALREPAVLRVLADAPPAPRGRFTAPPPPPLPLEVALALLARTWRPGQRAVIKATSFVSEIAAEILAASRDPVAILVYAEPLAYVRGILAGANSRVEARSLATTRQLRLVRRLSPDAWRSDPRSEGEQVAMSWLCEMLTLRQTAQQHRKVLWVNFDSFLDAPLEWLAEIFRALGAEPPQSELEALISGPIMRQYSKAPEHPYDAALRREVLASADWSHGAEIRRAMEWLQAVAAEHPALRAVFESLD
jgi:hypothetical protein